MSYILMSAHRNVSAIKILYLLIVIFRRDEMAGFFLVFILLSKINKEVLFESLIT